MKKSVDFTADYQERMRLLREAGDERPPTGEEMRDFALIQQLVEAQKSQFRQVKSQRRWNRLRDEFYPCLRDVAEICGGRLELEMDEQTLFGTLAYTGDHLMLNNDVSPILTGFAAALAEAEDVSLSPEDGRFTLRLVFRLYDEVRIADNTQEIQELETELWLRRLLVSDPAERPDTLPDRRPAP